MKRIRICEESEARALHGAGLFFEHISPYISEHPQARSLTALRAWKTDCRDLKIYRSGSLDYEKVPFTKKGSRIT